MIRALLDSSGSPAEGRNFKLRLCSQSFIKFTEAISEKHDIAEPCFVVGDTYALQISAERANKVVVVIPNKALVANAHRPLALACLTRRITGVVVC